MMVEVDDDAAEYGTVPTISRLGSLSVIILNDLYFWILSDGIDEFFAEDDANDSVAVATMHRRFDTAPEPFIRYKLMN